MKSISNNLFYVIPNIIYDYVDYLIELLNPSTTPIYYGRCFKLPNQTYGIIELSDILKDYCNFNEVLESSDYLETTVTRLNYPIRRFRISTKAPGAPSYTVLVSDEEILCNYQNTFYDTIPTSGVIPDILQIKREYLANINAPIPYDIVRKYSDTYTGCTVYYRPDGNNALLYANTVTKSQLNHFAYSDYFLTNPSYVEVWATTRQLVGGVQVETILPNSTIRYNYSNTSCKYNEYVIYWINRYGGLEMKLVDGPTVKTITNTKDQFEYYSRTIVDNGVASTNPIAFSKVNTTNLRTSYKITFNNAISDDEFNYLETLYSSNMIWLYDLVYLVWIPVIVSDDSFEYKSRRTTKGLLNYTISLESSNKNIRY